MTNDAPSRKRIGVPNWPELIPELPDFMIPGPTDPEMYAFVASNLKVALAFSEVFWPPFIEHDGLVLRSANAPDQEEQDSIANWMEHLKQDKSAVEAMLNHRHLVYMIGLGNEFITAERLRYLGNLLKDMWSAKLARDFPGRKFKVDLDTDDPDDFSSWQITFFQIRDAQ